MQTVTEKAFISMYISLREHCITVTQLKVTACHIFISQLKIYKEKENLYKPISHPVFLSASRSSVARATLVPKVSLSRRQRSGPSSIITGFANPMTILQQIFKQIRTQNSPRSQITFETQSKDSSKIYLYPYEV